MLQNVISFRFHLLLVCAFPFILGFSENAIEIRLLVNGNLVHTLCVPGIKLITSKVSVGLLSLWSKRYVAR